MDDLHFENPVIDTIVENPEHTIGMPPLKNNQGYVWKVRSSFGKDNYGSWSGVYIFKSVDLDKPVNQLPTDSYTTSDSYPKLVWDRNRWCNSISD